MHPALLLDDVLRQILEFCPTTCLPAVSRTCLAWRDPALDSIWCHLGSLIPLLNLVPGLVCVDGVYSAPCKVRLDLRIFKSYAARVKHITQRHDTRVHPALLSALCPPGITLLTMLTTTRLSSTDPHCFPAVLSLAPNLRQLDLDFGFKRGIADSSSDYIESMLHVALNIERIRLRGLASQRLNASISRMSNLRSLTLRTGPCLTSDTLVAISAFPHLLELDIDAGHLDAERLADSWSLSGADDSYFRSLHKLHISAQAPVVELLLRTLRPGSLQNLRIEATRPASAVDWSSIFSLISDHGSHTLEDLTIEHHLENLEDTDLDALHATTNTQPSTQNTHSHRHNNRITFDIIQRLAPLRRIRRLIIEATRAPDLCDKDIETLATWWPTLEHLDLGCLHSSECTLTSSPRATLACLRSVAASMQMLDTLILPLSITGVPPLPSSVASTALSRATFTSPFPPLDPAATAYYLHGLFPRLTQLEGTDQHEAEWEQVQQLLRGQNTT